MAKPLRVLIVEDRDDDVLLLVHELLRNGYDVTYQQVETAAEMSAALDQESWDIVVSDYVLPHFNAPAALQLVQERDVDIPFIIVSGVITEDGAVEAMRAGANDFFAKDKFARLAPAVERELREAASRRKRRLAEQALRESEARYRAVVEDQTELICRFLPDGTLTFVNGAFCSYVGKSAGELLGQNFISVMSDDDLNVFESLILSLTSENPTATFEYRVLMPDGQIRWQQWTNRATFDTEGSLVEFQAVGRDITERKQAEEALLDSEERYRSVVTAMAEGLILHDSDGGIIAANTSAERILGLSLDQMKRRELRDPSWGFIRENGVPFPGEDRPAQQTLRTGKPQSNVIIGVQKPHGELTWISVNSQPLFHEGETKPYAVVVTFSDITQLKEAEIKARELAVERGKMSLLRNFVREASHDLRTPLSVVKTSLYLLRKTVDSERPLRHLDTLEIQVDKIQAIFENLFDLSHLDRPEEEFRFANCDVNQLIEQIVEEMNSLLLDKSHVLQWNPDPNLATVLADVIELKRALRQLFLNAINYTERKGVITIRTRSEGAQAVITIEDNGIGIDEAEAHLIFEPFYRADKARSTSTGGAGLGLTITRKIVEAHQGTITVDSIPGKGSTFTICLPAQM